MKRLTCFLEYFSFLIIASFGAIFNFILTNRNFGKTWALQISTWHRALRKGKKAIVIRRFEKEADEMAKKLFKSSDLVKKLKNFHPYDPKTKKGNFKQIGKTFYIKRFGRWEWFLQICKLSDQNSLRSADDVMCDRVFFDEFTTTTAKYALYKGNEANDLMDIFFSVKREHKVRFFFFGNREYIENPYFDYFGIRPPERSYEGVRRYRGGSIAVMVINNQPKERNEYDKKVRSLLQGTAYGDYIYENAYKEGNVFKRSKTPPGATKIYSVCVQSKPLTLSIHGGKVYVKQGVNKSDRIFSDEITGKYRNEMQLVRKDKNRFLFLERAVRANNLYYENESAYAALAPLLHKFGIR